MNRLAVILLLSAGWTVQAADVDVYSSKDISSMAATLAKKGTPFADQGLGHFKGHYFMLAQRESTGSSELHEQEADVFVVESGEATLLSGGKIVNPHTQKPGEIRGTSISGGQRRKLAAGDIVHIPAGTPHQLLLAKGPPFTYFVIKVSGQ